MTLLLVPLLLLASAGGRVKEAERLAGEAVRLSAQRGPGALEAARRALALTEDFDPTAFVSAGRKGEVVEDAYQQARLDYRRHRGGLYAAMGEALTATERARAATRYLGRAALLDPTAERVQRYARALLDEGRAQEALDVLTRHGKGVVGQEAVALFERAADLLALPSAQAEIDRARLFPLGKAVEIRDGPVRLAASPRLSTGAPYRLGEDVAVFYMAATACLTCSEDLEVLRREVPTGIISAGVPLIVVAEDPERDHALRKILTLYRYHWPLLLGRGQFQALGAPAGSVFVVARGGWIGVVAKPPLADSVPAVLAAFSHEDLRESRPRAAWKARPPDRTPVPPPPGLLPDGLAPGEDLPMPGAFTAAADAYRAGKYLEALRFIQALSKSDDAWLLPPEERYDRALFLAGLGRRDEARKLLLAIGDSRFQEEVDRALERVGR